MRVFRMLAVVAVALVATSLTTAATAPPDAAEQAPELSGDLVAHDPALVRGEGGDDWYVYSTGDPAVADGTIQIRSSRDGRRWEPAGTVWDSRPAWLAEAVPGLNNLWAPEIHEHGGTYYLYYSASTFGSNTSVIALATNTTLEPGDPDYEWVDRGQVLGSVAADDYNAIDPGIVEDDDGTPWMSFGSYWSGIRMVELDWPSGLPASEGESLRLADRKEPPNAVEASSVVPHGGGYFLFTSFDACCRGVESTYRIVVGRSDDVTGPYFDRDGRSMLDGGGTTLLATAGDRIGPGGQSVSGGVLAHHYYDASANGLTQLALRKLFWADDGWPELRAGR